jgi:uncharacterized protein with PQ loop repeat
MLSLTLIAGAISSTMFVAGTVPMIYKAFATKNLRSYSLTSLLLNNLGNLIHALYVYSMPFGPIWLLHTLNLVTTALMLFWYLRYERQPTLVRRMLQFLCTAHSHVAQMACSDTRRCITRAAGA